jgi:magnesium transporter
MLWYIAVCSMIGGLSVTTGLGAAIVMTVMGDNQVRRLSLLEFLGHEHSFLL